MEGLPFRMIELNAAINLKGSVVLGHRLSSLHLKLVPLFGGYTETLRGGGCLGRIGSA